MLDYLTDFDQDFILKDSIDMIILMCLFVVMSYHCGGLFQCYSRAIKGIMEFLYRKNWM